jgi:uncharacterized Zn finger protein
MKKKIKVLLLAFVVLGLIACNGTDENQDSPTQTTDSEQGAGGSSSESGQSNLSVLDDFPEWFVEMLTEEEKEVMLAQLDGMTAAELKEIVAQLEGMDPSMMRGESQRMSSEDLEPDEDGVYRITRE